MPRPVTTHSKKRPPLEVFIDGPHGAPSSAILDAEHAVLVRTEISAGGGTIVSVRPRQVAVLCLEVVHTAHLNRMEKYDGSKSSCSLLPCRSASSG